jgi:hypothetical protein
MAVQLAMIHNSWQRDSAAYRSVVVDQYPLVVVVVVAGAAWWAIVELRSAYIE